MSEVKLSATSIREFSTTQLSALRVAFEHNLELIESELRKRKQEDTEGSKTVTIRLGPAKAIKKKGGKKIVVKKSATTKKTAPKKGAAKKKAVSKKKVEPTIKDMQQILSSHEINFAKSWTRDRHWGLIKKHNLVRETRKFTETRLGLAS